VIYGTGVYFTRSFCACKSIVKWPSCFLTTDGYPRISWMATKIVFVKICVTMGEIEKIIGSYTIIDHNVVSINIRVKYRFFLIYLRYLIVNTCWNC